jgi:glycosyltransferase involved in cell wall biosynthesis
MPEISLLCEYPTLNGGERSMLATLDGLRRAGFSPTVLAPPEGPLGDALAGRNVETIPFSCRAADGSRIAQSRLREQLADVLRRRRPAVLHANSLSMGRLSGPVAAELQLPSLAHLRDIVKLSRQAATDLNCHCRLLAVSHAVHDFHLAGGLAAERLHVLYNGVDLDEFRPRWLAAGGQELVASDTSPHPSPLPKGEGTLVGVVGQIGLRKGQDVLLRAAALLGDRFPNVHYLIVGERNSDKDESRRFERDLLEFSQDALPGRVHFLGRRDDVARLLPELTLLVHPARQEPLGRVLLEAAAAGLAVVATDVGGTREIFPPEANSARLVPPDNAAALAAAISDLLADAALRIRLGHAARRRAEEQFDIRKTVGELVRHYEALLSV